MHPQFASRTSVPAPRAGRSPMTRLLGAAALAVALCGSGAAHAGLITFDNPGEIDIDNATDTARYHEAGFVIAGPSASFLPLDGAMVGGFDTTPFTLSQEAGGPFGLQSFDVAPEDLGFGPGMLFVSGLLDGVQVASLVVDLSSASSQLLDSSWAKLTAVSFSGTGGFALDNIATVPEPRSFALVGAALLIAATSRQRRRR